MHLSTNILLRLAIRLSVDSHYQATYCALNKGTWYGLKVQLSCFTQLQNLGCVSCLNVSEVDVDLVVMMMGIDKCRVIIA